MHRTDQVLYFFENKMGFCIHHWSAVDWPLWGGYFSSLGHALVADTVVEK